MNPYRAVYSYRGRATAGVTGPGPLIEEPVVVVDGYYEPVQYDASGAVVAWGGYRVVAVSQTGGRHITDDPSSFTCTEPAMLVVVGTEPAEHDHNLGVGRPVVEGGRQVAMDRHCTVPGCAFVERIPSGVKAPR